MKKMQKLLLITFMMFAAHVAWAQEASTTEHLFKTYYLDSAGQRVDIPENEHVQTKITGILVHKSKMVLYGDKAKTNLAGKKDLYIEVLDTVQLQPQFFRLMKLKVKKGNREAVCWSNGFAGAKDHSSDFIPTVVFPVGDNKYRIDIGDVPSGNYMMMYQNDLRVLMEIYDFDK